MGGDSYENVCDYNAIGSGLKLEAITGVSFRLGAPLRVSIHDEGDDESEGSDIVEHSKD